MGMRTRKEVMRKNELKDVQFLSVSITSQVQNVLKLCWPLYFHCLFGGFLSNTIRHIQIVYNPFITVDSFGMEYHTTVRNTSIANDERMNVPPGDSSQIRTDYLQLSLDKNVEGVHVRP